MRDKRWAVLLLCLPFSAAAQSRPEMRDIFSRLERLERKNRELEAEVRSLREQLAVKSPPAEKLEPIEERVAVQEKRVEEHEQSKIQSEHRMPVSLTGMVLFNAFVNGRASADQQYPTTAAAAPGTASFGGSMRQTVLGLKFQGPQLMGGGQVSGSLYMDFFGGGGTALNQLMRLRIASVNIDWKNTTFSAGVDKPLVAPREPESLAQVGFSPLTGAGNLWLWQPQVRVEQRFHFGERAGLRAQLGLYQTSETGAGVPVEYRDSLDKARPGYEGRFEFWFGAGQRRFEIAPGFHVSDTHVLGRSIPSRIATLDWLIRPWERIDFSGAFYSGENIGVLGGLRQGVTVFPNDEVRAIAAKGGWAQLAYRPAPRLSFHLYGGEEDDRNADLLRGGIARNLVYAGNVIYRLGSNVLASFEASQTRTTYLGGRTRLNPHYDLSLAYLF